jgi:hypothetical protein
MGESEHEHADRDQRSSYSLTLYKNTLYYNVIIYSGARIAQSV